MGRDAGRGLGRAKRDHSGPAWDWEQGRERHEEGSSDTVKATEPWSWNVGGSWRSAGKNKGEHFPDPGCGGPRSGHGPPEPSRDSTRWEGGDVGSGTSAE